MFGQIIIGLILIFIGAIIVKKSEWMLNNFGSMGFFEKFLHTYGGSRLGYKIIGLILIFFGILISTNMISGFLRWLLYPFLKYSMPNK